MERSITDAALNPEINNARQAMVGKYDREAAPLIPMEDDDFIKKYSGPLLLGPFVPAIFALINIFFGQILLSSWTGTCVQALDSECNQLSIPISCFSVTRFCFPRALTIAPNELRASNFLRCTQKLWNVLGNLRKLLTRFFWHLGKHWKAGRWSPLSEFRKIVKVSEKLVSGF